MAPRRITTLDNAWDELVFTEIALSIDPETKDLVPTIEPLLARLEEVERARRSSWRGMLRAQAVFSDANFRADKGVNDFAWDLERAAGSQKDKQFKRYFIIAPSLLAKRALFSMATRVLGWIDGIKMEKEPEVSRHAPILESLARRALEAVEGVSKARGAAADTRTKVVDDFLMEVDAFRMDLAGELMKRAAASKSGAGWAGKFFKAPSRRRGSPQEEEPEGPSASPAPTAPASAP